MKKEKLNKYLVAGSRTCGRLAQGGAVSTVALLGAGLLLAYFADKTNTNKREGGKRDEQRGL